MPLTGARLLAAITLATALVAALRLLAPAPASAAGTMQAIFEDDHSLEADPAGTLSTFRMLGVHVVRVGMVWAQVAPHRLSHTRPRRFHASDPAAYPAASWSVFDTIVKDAQVDNIQVDIDLDGGGPIWATGPGAPRGHPHPNWEPSAREYGAFVRAVATRYSGRYVPRGSSKALPRVSFWSIWDEPNLGYTIAPQGVPGHLTVENSGHMYRSLLAQAWNALHQTGHAHDTILIGELAPRGLDYFGVFSSMKPLVFLRALYCVDSHYRPLRGDAAAMRGCPTTAAASRHFRAANPALFQAPGFSDHGWMRWYPPNREPQPDRDYSSFAEFGGLERALDRLQRVYRSRRRFPIYDDEFGYITDPPNHTRTFVSPATAAYYLNWAEYISWRDPRIATFENYLLRDPPPRRSRYDGWSSGLLTFTGAHKVTYSAWRLPLYLPITTTRPGRRIEVWGCARPAQFAHIDTGQPQTVEIQFAPASGGSFTTLATVPITNRAGYFDVRVAFPASGTVRLAWSYRALDPLLGYVDPLQEHSVYSRQVEVTVN
jgi:hypothetical protein